MGRKILKLLGQALFSILKLADRFITGSNSGIPFDEELRDPYSVYKILRNRGNILRSYSNRGWLVLGFDEAQQLFRDPQFSNDTRKNQFVSKALRAASPYGQVQFLDHPTLLQLDSPDHTCLRKLVNHGFNHKYILSMEPRIERIVEEYLDSYDEKNGQFDIVTQLAKPLPAIVIAELLGLSLEDREQFQDMSERFLGITVLGDDDLMTT